MELDHTVVASKSYGEAVAAVQDAAAERGFRVLAVHDVAATLAEKGFVRDPMSIVEVCNARHASDILDKDPKIGLMLPCPILVYEAGGEVLVATMRPTLIGGFYPEADLGDTPAIVEEALFDIVAVAAG